MLESANSPESKFWDGVNRCTACRMEGKPRTMTTARGARVPLCEMCDSHWAEFSKLPDYVQHPMTAFDMI